MPAAAGTTLNILFTDNAYSKSRVCLLSLGPEYIVFGISVAHGTYAQAHRHMHTRLLKLYQNKQTSSSWLLGAGAIRNLEESFVMLAGSASSLRHAPANASTTGIPLQPLDIKFAQMARVFEIASEATKAGIQACCFIAKAPPQSAHQYMYAGTGWNMGALYQHTCLHRMEFQAYTLLRRTCD